MTKQLKHWQDPLNGLIGLWFAVSPWVLGFADQRTAAINMVVVGILLIAVAFGAALVPRAWEEWSEAALGLWMVVSPWALTFQTLRPAMASAVCGGLVVLALAIWVLGTDKDYGGWWLRDRAAH